MIIIYKATLTIDIYNKINNRGYSDVFNTTIDDNIVLELRINKTKDNLYILYIQNQIQQYIIINETTLQFNYFVELE